MEANIPLRLQLRRDGNKSSAVGHGDDIVALYETSTLPHMRVNRGCTSP